MLGNSGNAIRFIDGKSNNRLKCTVAAHQRNIGTVQGGYHGDINTVSKQNLLGHKSCRSMRDGVMYVQYIELFKAHHINHTAGQRNLIGRVIEQRVV